MLHGTTQLDGRRRPADALILSGSCLSPTLPDGSRQVGTGKVALDFAVANALGQGHWHETLSSPGLAAENYALRKRQHQNMESKCAAVGVHFVPFVVEAQGAMTAEAARILEAISGAVASVEGLEQKDVREDMLQRISLLLWRCGGSRVVRRLERGSSEGMSASQRAAENVRILEPVHD